MMNNFTEQDRIEQFKKTRNIVCLTDSRKASLIP